MITKRDPHNFELKILTGLWKVLKNENKNSRWKTSFPFEIIFSIGILALWPISQTSSASKIVELSGSLKGQPKKKKICPFNNCLHLAYDLSWDVSPDKTRPIVDSASILERFREFHQASIGSNAEKRQLGQVHSQPDQPNGVSLSLL